MLTPVGASYWGGENCYTSGFTQIAWTENWNYGNDLNNSSVNTTDPYYVALTSGKPSEANGWFGLNTAEFLQETLSGLNTEQIIAGFENAQVLINGATRSAPLWRDGYQNVVAVRDGGLLQELIDTGFELVRVGATNPTGAAADGAWLEAVLEKDVVKVAGGLSQFVRGFEGTHNNPGYLYTRDYIDALDYGQRLMRVAAAVDDPLLDAEVLKADVLSEFVNLGGIFSALNPNVSYSSSDSPSPLSRVLIDNYLNHNSSQNLSGDDLEKYLRGVNKY